MKCIFVCLVLFLLWCVLLLGILLLVFGFVLVNIVVFYCQVLVVVDMVYDCILLVLVKLFSEQLQVVGVGDQVCVQFILFYFVLEVFEVDNCSCIYYCVSGFDGEMVLGFDDLFVVWLFLFEQKIYVVLVYFYDDEYCGDLVCMVVLL